MADDDLISSLYPPPPPYVKFFTTDNLDELALWNKREVEETNNDEVKTPPPGELKFLIPPKPPLGTHYRGYGNIWSFEDKLPSLKDANWEQLYQDNDESITSETKIKELHKLMDSLLLNFLELIGVVSIDPAKFEHKIKDISLILININHLLNTYRPHQSRESLIMLLKKKIDFKRLEIETMDKTSRKIKTRIKNLTEIDELDYKQQDSEVIETPSKESIKDEIISEFLQRLDG